MEDLVPGQKYLLKWATINPDGKIHDMVILEGEFIKYNDDKYYDKYVNYMKAPPNVAPHEELIGTILTPQYNDVIYHEYPFDNPLYPYSKMYKKFPLKENAFKTMGLFRITRLVKTVFKGVSDANWSGNNPYRFASLSYSTRLSYSTMINNNNGVINYGETLMWVDLNSPDISIRPLIDRVKLLQEKAVDSLAFPAAKEDMSREVKSFLGGKIQRKTNKRRKTNKQKKTNKRRKTNKRTKTNKRKNNR